MLLNRTEKLKRQVKKLERQVRNKHPVDFLILRIVNDRNENDRNVIIELKIAIK